MTDTDTDTCCTIAPYFRIREGCLEAFKEGCAAMVERTRAEPDCLFYGFSFDGDRVHCREGYADAESVLFHLGNVGELLQEALKLADLERLEVHGPASQLALLRGPMAAMNPQFFTLEMGFRR